jgi:hypothetical protein
MMGRRKRSRRGPGNTQIFVYITYIYILSSRRYSFSVNALTAALLIKLHQGEMRCNLSAQDPSNQTTTAGQSRVKNIKLEHL